MRPEAKRVVPRIAGIGAYVPSRVATNDEVLGYLRDQSAPYLSPEDCEALVNTARRKLLNSGCRERHWSAPDEWCTDLARMAAARALEDAAIHPEELDLIIFAGMAKAFVEPATAHVLRHELAATNASLFDLGDACTGIMKGLEVAGALISTGKYRTILVTAGERIFEWADYRCKSLDELTWKFGSLTIGDAGGALIVQATDAPDFVDDPRHWQFFYSFVDDSYSTCNMGLSHRVGEHYRLYSHSTRLFRQGRAAGEALCARLFADPTWREHQYENIFLHEVGNVVCNTAFAILRRIGAHIPLDTYRSVWPEHGNVATASLPLGMWYAKQEGRLRRGNRVAFYCPAAGVQAGIMFFRY
ncbi:hypothetical protein [uncultured Thiodictyon sp.]|uniref:3-oxoacyl-ACP synthase III family protein n=1 Tax=uncultured Thiodictyon sp. TaxID=1846217 RepID=UPI0025FF48E8|nr:hypothetical protein [uncultured Thiodictyon sp.]